MAFRVLAAEVFVEASVRPVKYESQPDMLIVRSDEGCERSVSIKGGRGQRIVEQR